MAGASAYQVGGLGVWGSVCCPSGWLASKLDRRRVFLVSGSLELGEQIKILCSGSHPEGQKTVELLTK